MKSIFTRPLFINPQAYLTIPELSYIQTATPFDLTEDSYNFTVNTSGKIESKLLKAGDDCILHLDLYSIDGNCVLGEWNITDSVKDINIDNLSINTKGNKLIITYNNN